MKRVLAALIALLSFATVANAGFSALQLFNMCNSKNETEKTLYKMWIGGFGIGVMFSHTNQHKLEVCLPDNFSGEEATLIVEKFMRDHPQSLHNDASVLTFLALWTAFPCPEIGKSK
jgi:hypothetical protein